MKSGSHDSPDGQAQPAQQPWARLRGHPSLHDRGQRTELMWMPLHILGKQVLGSVSDGSRGLRAWPYFHIVVLYCPSPSGSDSKDSACNSGDPGLIPGSGRSPRGGNGNRLQYPCLENPMDRAAWWATVLGVEKSRTQLKRTNSHSHTHAHLSQPF